MLCFLVPPFSDGKLGFRLQAATTNENRKLALTLEQTEHRVEDPDKNQLMNAVLKNARA